MQIKDVLKYGMQKLQAVQEYLSPQRDTEEILAYLLKIDRKQLYLWENKNIKLWQYLYFKYLIYKRSKLYPLAYIIKEWTFYNLNLKMRNDVFIPRPETELLVDYLLNYLNENKEKVSIYEIGGGSGAIALALLNNTKFIKKYIVNDINQKAINLMKENFKKYELDNFIKIEKILKQNKYDFSYLQNYTIDILISNPPYVPWQKYKLSKTIKHESDLAITDKEDGLLFFKTLFQYLQNINKTYKLIILEFDEDNFEQIKKLSKTFLEKNYFVKFLKDYNDFYRFIVLKNKNNK